MNARTALSQLAFPRDHAVTLGVEEAEMKNRFAPVNQYDDRSRIPPFPCSLGASEPMPDYRYVMGAPMRRWVLWTLNEQADYHTVSEADAVRICEQQGLLQVGKGLHGNEKKLIAEAVRDVVVNRETRARNAEWLEDYREGA
jgi:hypothetical protein